MASRDTLAQEAVREDRSFAAAHAWLGGRCAKSFPREEFCKRRSAQVSATVGVGKSVMRPPAGLSDDTAGSLPRRFVLRVNPDQFGTRNLVNFHIRQSRREADGRHCNCSN